MKDSKVGAQPEDIQVQILSGLVLREGDPIRLSVHERQVAVALALQSHSVPSEYLCEQLYPDREYREARNTLKVYVCRLRSRVAADFIVHDSVGYSLNPRVRTDIAELSQVLADSRKLVGPLDASDVERVASVGKLLRAERPSFLLSCDWYATAARRLARQGRDAVLRLAESAYRRGDFLDAISIVRELIYDDACDEAARELAIRAHLQAGQQGAAIAEFRLYRRALEEELQVNPPRDLIAMAGL